MKAKRNQYDYINFLVDTQKSCLGTKKAQGQPDNPFARHPELAVTSAPTVLWSEPNPIVNLPCG